MYDYNVYYRQNCIIPLALIVFCCILSIKVGWSVWKKGMAPNLLQWFKENIVSCIFIVLFLFLVTINSIHLLRGGIYLLFENEADTIKITGVIEKTIEIDAITGSKYNVDNNFGRGEAIVVNGNKYYIMSYGDLKEGDQVILEVLPRSKFVLKIEKITN